MTKKEMIKDKWMKANKVYSDYYDQYDRLDSIGESECEEAIALYHKIMVTLAHRDTILEVYCDMTDEPYFITQQHWLQEYALTYDEEVVL